MENKKVDRRVIVTKRFLKSSLIELLRYKSIHEITIKEICEKADVNRTTFYNHYSSQFDLYDEVINDVFDNIHIKQHETFDDPSLTSSQAAHLFLTRVFEFAEDNIDLCMVLLGDNGSVSMGEAFTKHIDSFITVPNPSKHLRYSMQFIAAGILNLIWLWLNEKDRVPASKMAELIGVFYTKGIETAFGNKLD